MSVMRSNATAWWRGKRGEWYVVAQLALIAVVFFGPRTLGILPEWPRALAATATFVGMVLMAAGVALLLASLPRLGSNLTPLPHPKRGGVLVQTGPYGIVRHPMYSGGIALAYGWAFVVHGWLTIVYATALMIFLDFKATREEQWLATTYPEYPAYQQRVRKLIPFPH
jgi:protein-S-isoprenylcysteine O-methyltransferase Ste14